MVPKQGKSEHTEQQQHAVGLAHAIQPTPHTQVELRPELIFFDSAIPRCFAEDSETLVIVAAVMVGIPTVRYRSGPESYVS